jgi:hypothetical protein
MPNISTVLFRSPYDKLAPAELARPSIDIALDDYQYLKSIMPGRGSIQTSIQLLVSKLCHELRKRNITDYHSADVFAHVVGHLCALDRAEFGLAIDTILVKSGLLAASTGGSATQPPHGQAAQRDVQGGIAGVCAHAANESNLSSDAARNPVERSGTGGTGGSKAKTVSRSKRQKGTGTGPE